MAGLMDGAELMNYPLDVHNDPIQPVEGMDIHTCFYDKGPKAQSSFKEWLHPDVFPFAYVALFTSLIASPIYHHCISGSQEDQTNESPAALPSRQQSNSNQFISRQPSDESAVSVVVTNMSDLADSDAQLSEYLTQSSEVLEGLSPLSSPQDEPIATSEIPRAAQLSIDNSQQINSATANRNDNTVQPSTVIENNSTAQSSSTVLDTVSASQSGSSQQREPEISNSNTDGNSQETPSFEKLGIITARPKVMEYGVFATRMESFNKWPEDHHLKPLDLVNAGFYYSGRSDSTRCFYCGGGIWNWERDDDVWVEHARYFPKCAFLLQEVGKDFLDAVQAIKHTGQITITYNDVIRKMEDSGVVSPFNKKEENIARDPAVVAVTSNGFDKDQILKLALEIRKEGELLSSDKLYKIAKSRNMPMKNCGSNLCSDSDSIRKGGDTGCDQEMIETLRDENTELRQQTMCKICMDKEVAVAFLPCGHLVSCTECACALTACPLCRVSIKGIVRTHIIS